MKTLLFATQKGKLLLKTSEFKTKEVVPGTMMAQYPNPVKMGGMNGAAKTDNS